MDRWACVDVPALPLQLLLRRHREWTDLPVAVVDEDRPQGRVLWVSERARRSRVWPGCRYSEGLSLCAGLRAGVVEDVEVRRAVAELVGCLHGSTPEVEPSAAEPGVFWLNATGVDGPRRGPVPGPALAVWAARVAEGVRSLGLRAAVVVGFDRFGTYALARASTGVVVLGSRAEERRRADSVPLHRLGLDPALREALGRLGIDDVGGFRRLPAGGLRERFGDRAFRLHRLAHGAAADPLVPVAEVLPVGVRHDLEPDQVRIDVAGLLLLCEQRLAALVQAMAAAGNVFAELRLRLLPERGAAIEERVRPAEPTLDRVQLLDLLRLRLQSVHLDAELAAFELHAEVVPARPTQAALFGGARRDLAAGDRALARVRAELGPSAVVAAELRDGHLPEARFGWQPFGRLRLPQPRARVPARLVRRVAEQPRPLPAQRAGPDGWLIGDPSHGMLQNLWGPYVISGGWWHREQHREYYFAETRRGDVLWVFHDRRRNGWFAQGVVD